MKINAHTKVSEVIKTSSQAIDAFISVSPRFSKLKNPLLRKMMAPRVSLEQAAKIGGVRIDDIFIVLKPLGFDIENNMGNEKESILAKKNPAFVATILNSNVTIIDVRDIIATGNDPLKYILENLKNVKDGEILCLINTFEPIPLIHLLQKKGYESYVKNISTDEVHTYFHKSSTQAYSEAVGLVLNLQKEDFQTILKTYKENIIETDVRNMEMPLPMLTIMKMLESLPKKKVLYVHHKKIPVYLLPELEDMGFEYFINEIAEGDVKLIIRHKL